MSHFFRPPGTVMQIDKEYTVHLRRGANAEESIPLHAKDNFHSASHRIIQQIFSNKSRQFTKIFVLYCYAYKHSFSPPIGSLSLVNAGKQVKSNQVVSSKASCSNNTRIRISMFYFLLSLNAQKQIKLANYTCFPYVNICHLSFQTNNQSIIKVFSLTVTGIVSISFPSFKIRQSSTPRQYDFTSHATSQ